MADLPPHQVATDFAATLFTEEVPTEIVQSYVELMTDFRPVGVRAIANALADADLREVLPTHRRARRCSCMATRTSAPH